MRHALGVILLMVVGAAQAMPLTWTLEDVVFDDGGTAYGSFIYDASTNIFSDIDVTTTLGTVLSGAHYQFATFQLNTFGNGVGLTDVDLPDLTGVAAFFMEFDSLGGGSLTNAGGTISIVSFAGGEAICGDPDCSVSTGFGRSVNLGGVVTAVPIPAAVWLFGSGLGLLGWFRRRQTA